MAIVSQSQNLNPHTTARIQRSGIRLRSGITIGGASIGQMQRLRPQLQWLGEMTTHVRGVTALISSLHTQILVQIEAAPSPTQLDQILSRPKHQAPHKGCIQRLHGSSGCQPQRPSERERHQEPLTQMLLKPLS
jgi:hypothetical protein